MTTCYRLKSWGMLIAFGYFFSFFGCAADYPMSGIALMPLCDCQKIFQVAQHMMLVSGYTLVKSSPETGLISGQKELGDIVKTMSFHIGIDKDKSVRILMECDSSEVIAPQPLALTRLELVNITKVIAKQMGFSENDVFVQFGKEQKALSSYKNKKYTRDLGV